MNPQHTFLTCVLILHSLPIPTARSAAQSIKLEGTVVSICGVEESPQFQLTTIEKEVRKRVNLRISNLSKLSNQTKSEIKFFESKVETIPTKRKAQRNLIYELEEELKLLGDRKRNLAKDFRTGFLKLEAKLTLADKCQETKGLLVIRDKNWKLTLPTILIELQASRSEMLVKSSDSHIDAEKSLLKLMEKQDFLVHLTFDSDFQIDFQETQQPWYFSEGKLVDKNNLSRNHTYCKLEKGDYTLAREFLYDDLGPLPLEIWFPSYFEKHSGIAKIIFKSFIACNGKNNMPSLYLLECGFTTKKQNRIAGYINKKGLFREKDAEGLILSLNDIQNTLSPLAKIELRKWSNLDSLSRVYSEYVKPELQEKTKLAKLKEAEMFQYIPFNINQFKELRNIPYFDNIYKEIASSFD